MFVWLLTDAASLLLHMYKFLPFVFVPRICFGKAEAAYHHHGLGSYRSTWYSCTLQLYILPNISLFYYLQVHLTYLDMESKANCSCMCEQWTPGSPLRFLLIFKHMRTRLTLTLFNLCTFYHCRHSDSSSSSSCDWDTSVTSSFFPEVSHSHQTAGRDSGGPK